jgi:hypothetical protein
MSRKDVVDLKFMLKLVSFLLVAIWDLDHDTRMNLIDERDGSLPNPVNIRKLLLNSHCGGRLVAGKDEGSE